MLGAVERSKRYCGVRAESLDDAHAIAADAGRIRDEADAPATEEIEIFFEEEVDA